MLAMSCCHDINASISSSCCVSNNVEETEDSIGQDKILNGASSNSSSSSSHGPHLCLMARDSKVSPTFEPNTSSDDEDEDIEEEEVDVASLNKKGEMVFHVLCRNKIACSNFMEILTIAIESQKLIKMHEDTIDKLGAFERENAIEIASLENALEEEQTTNESLEETFTLELSKVKEDHDRALEVANDLKLKK
jgi:hypothetical protein